MCPRYQHPSACRALSPYAQRRDELVNPPRTTVCSILSHHFFSNPGAVWSTIQTHLHVMVHCFVLVFVSTFASDVRVFALTHSASAEASGSWRNHACLPTRH